MIGIIGRKLGMTQIFNEPGQQIPCTVIEARAESGARGDRQGERWRTRRCSSASGSSGCARESQEGRAHAARPPRDDSAEVGHAKKAGPRRRRRTCCAASGSTSAKAKIRRSRRTTSATSVKVDVFAVGEQVKVTGTTKGRGFQGVVKRHGFGGGPNTHGNTKHRRPGSIGPGTDPSRVIKGKKMPGHYGAERHTQTHLRVEKIDAERNLIYIRGSVAGPTNGIVLVRKQA